MASLSAKRLFHHGADGYEAARRETVWNRLLPERFPAVIVQAYDTDDVVATIRYARAHGHQVGVRSGGHSWTASHLRDGGVLLDVSRLDHCCVDTDRMTATVGPGKIASVFATELDSQGLFFPAGHCQGIALGGYLLQGGYGWNSKVVGPACESVLGLEVVTADGEMIYCDTENHPDLYWAARGSGPGFFGVVTSFTLRLHPRPAVLGTCLYMYPVDVADEVFTWGRRISPEVDDRVELQIRTSRGAPGLGPDQPTITVASPVFAGSAEEATKALAILGTCPVVDKATVSLPYAPTTLANWYAAVMTKYPPGHRYIVDNMFTSASAEELLPGIRKIIETMPPHPSHFIFTGWKPSADRANMVYGLEDDIYLALYTAWHDPADDERYADWAGSNMAAMSHLATGISLADENLGRRPATFITDQNMMRLDNVRSAYDPDGL
ncbi:MAG: FAD-binding oxidoreductase, partial [Mycobacterium sp.]|nr:FAD-binding oxidoreductase [Mycobacterium sp.]